MRHSRRQTHAKGQGCPGGRRGRTRMCEGAPLRGSPESSPVTPALAVLWLHLHKIPHARHDALRPVKPRKPQGRRHCHLKPRSLGAASSAALITQTPSPSENRMPCFRTERSFCSLQLYCLELERWREQRIEFVLEMSL